MQLTEVAGIAGFEVVRDGEFKALGLLADPREWLLVQLYDRKYVTAVVRNPCISCVITTPALAAMVPDRLALALCKDPSAAFYALHEQLMRKTSFYWEDFDTQIAADAKIHGTAYVAAKNVRIGPGTLVEPNVTIHERSIIGSQAVIRSGSVIGGEGFEPKWVGGRHLNVPHAGGVLIGDRVEIQSNCHVACSVYGGFTKIGDDTKLDAMVNVSHVAVIGQGCEIAAGAVIAGSAHIGNNVWLGPGSVVSSGITIGDGAYVTLGSVVVKDVPAGQRVTGNFAIEHSKFMSFFLKVNRDGH